MSKKHVTIQPCNVAMKGGIYQQGHRDAVHLLAGVADALAFVLGSLLF